MTVMLKEKAAEGIALKGRPPNRAQYVQECQASVTQFKTVYPLHWIEYIRGNRPPDYTKLLEIKKWLGTFGDPWILTPNPNVGRVHQLIAKKLHKYRRPRGVVVAAIVLEKLYVSYSLCNFAAGDQWNRSIALWKAMQRITKLEIDPCPMVEVNINMVLAEHEADNDYITWTLQFPSSARSTVVRLTRRVIGQYLDFVPEG